MTKNKKLALNSRIQTYQILTNDDEVCIPSLSRILIANIFQHFFSELLKTQGKECLITWLQQTLLDACCVKINGKDMFKSDGKSLEPVLYHFNGKINFSKKL
jgi:hypothetical protein